MGVKRKLYGDYIAILYGVIWRLHRGYMGAVYTGKVGLSQFRVRV